jgi:hypothetical protein
VERHTVEFSFDQMWGPLSIRVDGQRVIRDWRLVSVSRTKTYRFMVGTGEPHEVVIEKVRPLVLAGFRGQLCKVTVDGQAAGEYSTYR